MAITDKRMPRYPTNRLIWTTYSDHMVILLTSHNACLYPEGLLLYLLASLILYHPSFIELQSLISVSRMLLSVSQVMLFPNCL